MVAALGLSLVIAGLVKALIFTEARQRSANWRIAACAIVASALVLVLLSSLWLIINPTADQPLAAVFERATGLGPGHFLGEGDRDTYESATRDMVRFQGEVDRLNSQEKAARYEGAPLPDDEIRRIASYQQSFSEMTRGEQFVQEVLRGKARSRERWTVGLPAIVIAIVGLGLLVRSLRRNRST
jgi:zinc/manganese transport system permease protein